MAQWKQIWLGTMRLRGWSLASLGGLRIQCCPELWYRLQMQLRSGIAVAVVSARSYSSDSTPSLETSICHRCCPKKKKEPKKFFSTEYSRNYHNIVNQLNFKKWKKNPQRIKSFWNQKKRNTKFILFYFFKATAPAFGSSQARGRIETAAAGL